MKNYWVLLAAVVFTCFLVGLLIGWFGASDDTSKIREWRESQVLENNWFDQPLKSIVESGRWEVDEAALGDPAETSIDELRAKLLAVVMHEYPYALIQRGSVSDQEVLKVAVDDMVGEWRVASISDVTVLLVNNEQENQLSLFEGVYE